MIAIWSKNFKLLFFLKKPKNYRQGKQPIYMRITIDGRRVDLSTQRDCEPNRWNARAGQATGTKEEIKILNSYLSSLQTRVYEVHRTLIDKNEPVTVANIKNHLRGNTERARMVLEVFHHHNDQLKLE